MDEDVVLPNIGQTRILFDVFVSDPLIVDQFTYKLWLNGYNEEETAFRRHTQITIPSGAKNWSNMILSDTYDQYRNFRYMEHNLKHPVYLGTNTAFQLAPHVQKMMVESYYEVDDIIMREIVGRKLTNGLRKDLEELKSVRVKNCLRQFDNLRRIYKAVIANLRTPACDLIQKNFCLSKELASKYMRMVFMCWHRFDTTKKRLHFFTFSDFDKAAQVLMSHWLDPYMPNCIEIDVKLKDDVRDLKAYLFSSKAIPDKYRKFVKSRFQNSAPPMTKERIHQLDGKYKSILKAIVNIGANVSDSKEFKDILEDMVEKIADPCNKIDMTPLEVDYLFIYMEEVFETNILEVLALRHASRFALNWRRYLEGLRGIMTVVYPLVQKNV